jgi:uncharacterized membrane protein
MALAAGRIYCACRHLMKRRNDPYAEGQRNSGIIAEAHLPAFVWVYLAGLLAMLAPDAIWLTLAGPALYRPALGDLLAESFSPVPAILFYLLYVLGLTTLSAGRNVAESAWRGALFGLCAYGTYDLTNQATLRHWPTYLTLADLAWGTLLSAFAAAMAALAQRRLTPSAAASARTR